MKRRDYLVSMMTVGAALALSVSPLQGADTAGRWGLGLQGGAYKLVLTDHSDAWTPGWLVNGDLKYEVTPRVAIGVEGSLMRTYLADLSQGSKMQDGARLSTDNINGGPRQRAFVAGLFAEYHFLEDKSWSPYVVAGPGVYLWKWTDKDGTTLMSDAVALDDPARVGMRVPQSDLGGDPYEMKDQELYAMIGTGVEFFPSKALSFEVGAKFRYLTHLLTSFTDDQDIVGSDPGQLDLPKGVAEVFAGLTYHFGGEGCPPSSSAASGNPTSGAAPLTVQFNGSVMGGCPEYTYDWNFGDGGSSSAQNPHHTYAMEGSYYASLTVTDSKGTPSQSGVSITASCPQLTSTASGNPTNGTAPLTVKFEGSSSGGCPTIAYKWVFGDGGTSSDQNPSHTYQTEGSYTATLTVTDSKVGTSQKTISITAIEEFIPTPEKPVILKGVNFEYDKAVLLRESVEILDRVAASLITHPDVNIEVAGHCDSDGSDTYNLGLSDRRAKAVRDYLIEKGIPATRIMARGYGESEPIADNATAEGKAANRRVELKRR
ncbi:MAG: PKD domain-containing protein [Candidatus Eisenbacteria bacterium]